MSKTIELTDEQYRELVKVLFCSSHVIRDHAIGMEEMGKSVADLEQYILSYVKAFHCSDMTEEVEEMEGHSLLIPAGETEREILEKYIRPFEEQAFWESLIIRLADLMVEREGKTDRMSKEEKNFKEMEYFQIVAEEIERNGLKNIYIKGMES